MAGKIDFLKDKSTILIFTYSPAGLGHLRVMDALYNGLPEGTPQTILGAVDPTVAFFHRFSSVHPIARYLFEKTQSGILEDIFTYFYRWSLRRKTDIIYDEILSTLNKNKKAKRVVIIATHFALAHKIGVIKEKIEKERNIKIILVLQVTDDSPQQVWYVPEADVIFVPSEYTKEHLLRYAEKAHFKKTEIIVTPYPVAPSLSWQMSEKSYQDKVKQVKSDSKSKTHIVIPISGAAVGMEYFLHLTEALHKIDERYIFHVLVQKTVYTQFFLDELDKRNYIELHTFETDREVVDKYEEEYKSKVISLEITKPSEQSFKALLNPTQIGGPILLFVRPVGRQEYDNLNFLRSHRLIPDHHEQSMLWGAAVKNMDPTEELFNQAKEWRGMRILNDAKKSAIFIDWSLKRGLLHEMMKFRAKKETFEVSPHGVDRFWKKVDSFLK